MIITFLSPDAKAAQGNDFQVAAELVVGAGEGKSKNYELKTLIFENVKLPE
jgi:hypothetical protein